MRGQISNIKLQLAIFFILFQTFSTLLSTNGGRQHLNDMRIYMNMSGEQAAPPMTMAESYNREKADIIF
jgi:hypothetical protein